MYVSNNLNYDETNFSHLNLMTPNTKLQCMSLEIPNIRQIILIHLYRPPQGPASIFIKQLYDTLSNINRNVNSEIYMFGDFNIDMLDKKSQNVKDLLQFFFFFEDYHLLMNSPERAQLQHASIKFLQTQMLLPILR